MAFSNFWLLGRVWNGLNESIFLEFLRLLTETLIMQTQVEYYRLLGHYPAGGSANTMTHLLQNYNFGLFSTFE